MAIIDKIYNDLQSAQKKLAVAASVITSLGIAIKASKNKELNIILERQMGRLECKEDE